MRKVNVVRTTKKGDVITDVTIKQEIAMYEIELLLDVLRTTPGYRIIEAQSDTVIYIQEFPSADMSITTIMSFMDHCNPTSIQNNIWKV